MRAFLNGRIDLTQAEAVRDLIDSQTLYQAKVAAQQLEGASRRLQPIKQKSRTGCRSRRALTCRRHVSVMPDADSDRWPRTPWNNSARALVTARS